MDEALSGIADVRFLVAIMFGRQDTHFVERVLLITGFAFDSSTLFAERLRKVHAEWVKTGKLIGSAIK